MRMIWSLSEAQEESLMVNLDIVRSLPIRGREVVGLLFSERRLSNSVCQSEGQLRGRSYRYRCLSNAERCSSIVIIA